MERKKRREPSSENAKARRTLTIIAIVLMVIMLAGFYLRFAWNRYQHGAESEALRLAHSVEALLHAEHIEALRSDDSAASEALLVEHSLVHLVEATDSIYYAYILKQQNGSIAVMADSSAAKAAASNPIRRHCEETAEVNRLPFDTGQSILAEPISAPCGEWIRALVPIYDLGDENVIAALGLNYSAAEWQANLWNRMIPDFVIVACLLILAFALFHLWHHHSKLKKMAENLAFQEALYRNIFEQAPIGIILQGYEENQAGTKYVNVNPMGEAILGRTVDDLKNINWPELTHEEDLASELPQFGRFTKGEIDSYAMEKRLIKPDGAIVWVNFKLADLSSSSLYGSMYLCLLEDISEQKESGEALRESERSKSVFFAHLPGMAYRCKIDPHWTMEFVSEGCYELTGYKPASLVDNRAVSYNEIISPEYRDAVRAEWERVLLKHKRYRSEYEIITESGENKWVLELGQGIYDADGNAEVLEGIVLDISERKLNEHQIIFLREHDFLTGLYNLNHIEREKKRLDQPEFWPLSLAICDINGLSMINDAYGREEGDQLIVRTAKLIQGCLSGEYVLGHTGGGEFILLLPSTSSRAARQIKADIKNTIERYNRANANTLHTISVSIGYSTKEAADQQMQDVTKAAEEYLNKRKLLSQDSSHSAIVSSIMATLYAKSQETEQHGQRLGWLCQMTGEELGLEQKDLDDLQLVSKLHDIGKIGIADHILNKPGKLSEEEWKIMKQHSEIGHRIAMATPQLEHIADYILHHHERWDGKGYPMGLKGQEIPLVSRILSIADAFDAMTEDRIYRKAMSHEAAIEEIERNSGTQFDPDMARLFAQLMANSESLDHSVITV